MQAAVAWPPGYRAMMTGLMVLAVGVGLLAGLLAIFWSPWLWVFAIGGALMAYSMGAAARHMRERPMLAVHEGRLLCRLEGTRSGKSARLTNEHWFALDEIESIGREVQPWPGKGGERHVYRLHLRNGRNLGLVPRPIDPGTRQAMADFFDRQLPGRVQETRIG
ncbi:hypothetical protein [Arenimonas sp. MALMAid1274]|uniref:hypothetical protein n=1 Tax=Arenimonas sp. MALMAid1274 TaxID=3411630 RepID=UPI003B9E598A